MRTRGAMSPNGNRFRRAVRTLAVVIACSLAYSGFATTFRYMTPAEVLLAADLVFLGTVSDVVTETRDGRPWTLVTLRLDDLYLGFGYEPMSETGSGDGPDDAPQWQDPDLQVPDTVTLAFLGGDSASAGSLLVSGSPTWRIEETYLVAAYQQDGLASPVVGFRQGLWRLGDDGFTDLDGTALAVGDDGAPVRSALTAGRSQVLFAVRSVLAGDVTPAPGAVEQDRASDDQDPEPGTPPAGDDAPASDDATTPHEELGDPNETPGESDPAAAGSPPPAIEVSYDVADEGGPLLLSESVARAAQAWRDAAGDAVELTLVSRPGSPNVLRYGDESLFGPDTVSLTAVTGDGSVTVYLSPITGPLVQTALVHELGVVLGIREGGSGVMASALRAPVTVPSPAEVAELVALSLYRPADLTRDGVVDFYDLLELAARYGQRGVNLVGDLDGSGTVDDADVEELRRSYQFAAPATTVPEEPDATPVTPPASSPTDAL